MHKHGFTLVEILVAVAIIGIVAALTIPSISKAYQKRVLTTQLQRTYAEISHAAGMVLADEMMDDFKRSNAIKNMNFVGKYIVVSQNRNGFADTYGYYNDKYASYNLYENEILKHVPSGISENDYDKYFKCGITKAGAAICINKNANGIFDINGTKGPNLIGRDAFSITIKKNGQVVTNRNAEEEFWGNPYRVLECIIKNEWDIDKPSWWE